MGGANVIIIVQFRRCTQDNIIFPSQSQMMIHSGHYEHVYSVKAPSEVDMRVHKNAAVNEDKTWKVFSFFF